MVNLITCKQLWSPICYCSQDLDRWCPPPPSAAPQPPCSPPRQQNINRAYNVNVDCAASVGVATLTLAAQSLHIFCLLSGALCIRELFVQLAVQRFRLKFTHKLGSVLGHQQVMRTHWIFNDSLEVWEKLAVDCPHWGKTVAWVEVDCSYERLKHICQNLRWVVKNLSGLYFSPLAWSPAQDQAGQDGDQSEV